ncbi:nicotinate-nucleotide adenylyltransferase [Candidatus Poribacteria bacterium]|nr:nicotinate-nucleotide adenylyltransferase [Candidatus Poribacteria bacterium]
MGGTFNPPHLGHLICAEEVYDYFKFDELIFMPSARPPHKEYGNIIDPEHRYRMTVLATQGNPHFCVSRMEVDRPGRSYTIQTVRDMKALYGEETGISWIVGADAILEMHIWKDIDHLLNICNFIAINRPGYDIDKANRRFLDKVHLFEVTNVDISASEIRERVKQGKSIKYLVTHEVENYINKNRLYYYG